MAGQKSRKKIALIATASGRKALGMHGARGFWLNIMLLGASLFGAIDHFWHGELFLVGTNWMADIALGSAITAGVFGAWGIIALKHKTSHQTMMRMGTGILRKNK